ncbi:4-hydroxy-tetrahydrodipicolinate synthase [Saccharopolyspora sp. TS4A08]|uniref:4-hydroxy-tetrahydrodipicolinate synthase n=1 Tax=Saccharopolyspora ipomoeae TaxID=3042027 RepID=A0ABT6PIJ0_9PSEU|nr:4-hydroxy-tetrahydrodipicolinate synthase [Saccharopolyspora sp. TS4A08]MDI2027660.1 4-hydroxy-tetrahydrodipicolinate synthase [Saccharopolyspora sp. TS4A08]
MSPQLGGILTALPTPFAPDGKIDVDALSRVVERNIDGGVDGLVACGSTGEFAVLSEQERMQVVETVVAQAAGRVPVVAQTGAVSTAEAIRLSRHAQQVGASVVMLVTPYYEPLSEAETAHYLRTVAQSVEIPVMLYNLPGVTGVDLSPETIGELAREVDNIRYVKDTNADMSRVRQLIHRYGDVISTFGGWDTLILATLTEGAAGVVVGSANIVPAELVSIHRALQAGELDRARAEWSRLYPLMESLMTVPFISAVKSILGSLGLPVGVPRSPLMELDADTADRVAAEAAGALGAPAPVRATTGSVRRTSDARPLVSQADLAPSRHFVDGGYVDSTSGRVLDVVDPCSEQVLCRTPDGTAEDVDRAVAAAVAAKASWARRVPKDRSDVLHAVADRVQEHADLLARLESANTGKPLAVSHDDIAGTIDTFRFMAGAVRAGTSMAADDYLDDHLSVIRREPVGVVGVVTPWNYPLMMAAWKIAPILAAGNTCVLKPSEQTPVTTLKFAELVADLIPPGVLNVVTGRGDVVGARLSSHPDVDLVALTGSVSSGRAVARAAAEGLKRVHLELGGKAPVVIFEDADLALAASTLRTAAFWNSGQECGAACRVLVHESVADRFVDLLVREAATLTAGEPTVDGVEIGPVVSRAHFDRVRGYLERAQRDGARAVLGGGALEGPGYYIAPTVLVDVPEGAEIAREEVFGPVVTVETFRDEDEAIRRANDVPYGLSASVWTDDARRSHDLPARLDAGTVWVNSHLALANEVPWGGFKGSGYGRDLSIYALDDYSRTKHVMHHHARS